MDKRHRRRPAPYRRRDPEQPRQTPSQVDPRARHGACRGDQAGETCVPVVPKARWERRRQTPVLNPRPEWIRGAPTHAPSARWSDAADASAPSVPHRPRGHGKSRFRDLQHPLSQPPGELPVGQKLRVLMEPHTIGMRARERCDRLIPGGDQVFGPLPPASPGLASAIAWNTANRQRSLPHLHKRRNSPLHRRVDPSGRRGS